MAEHISMNCPHCREATEVTRARVDLPLQITGVHVYAEYTSGRGAKWWIGVCNACRNVVLVMERGVRIYPQPVPSPTDQRVSKNIREDLDEAKLCLSVGAFRGSATLSRRALQAACVARGAPKMLLWKQINWLREQAHITEDVKAWAHEVRFVGNDGAHPPEDPAAEAVTEKDAENVLELTEQLLDVLFVMPAIAAEQRAKRTGKTATTPPDPTT